MTKRTLAAIAVCFVVLTAVGLSLCIVGCSTDQLQKASDSLSGASANLQSVATSTTRPTGTLAVIEAAVPASGPYIQLGGAVLSAAAGVLGVLGGWAAAAASKNGQIANTKTALADVVSDIATYKDPATSYPAKTEKIFADVAGLAAALPVPSIAATG